MPLFRFDSHAYVFAKQTDDVSCYMERITRYREDCGCSMGGVFAVLALAATIILSTVDQGHARSPKFYLASIGLTLTAAAVGKLFGILVARIRLQRLCGKLLREGVLEEKTQRRLTEP